MARNRVHLAAELDSPPEAVFTALTDRFDELWAGKMEYYEQGRDPAEPRGLGAKRRLEPSGVPGHLDEEIVTHERPRLIEYRVINEDAAFQDHLGRIELSERDGATRVDYTISFDYRPEFAGPVAAAVMRLGWRLRGARRLRAAADEIASAGDG